MAFSSDSKLLAAADIDGAGGMARLWSTATGHSVGGPLPAATGSGDAVEQVAFSPDGRLLATADSDGTARLWSTVTGRPVGSPLPRSPRTRRRHDGVVFSPGGKLLAATDTDCYTGSAW